MPTLFCFQSRIWKPYWYIVNHNQINHCPIGVCCLKLFTIFLGSIPQQTLTNTGTRWDLQTSFYYKYRNNLLLRSRKKIYLRRLTYIRCLAAKDSTKKCDLYEVIEIQSGMSITSVAFPTSQRLYVASLGPFCVPFIEQNTVILAFKPCRGISNFEIHNDSIANRKRFEKE